LIFEWSGVRRGQQTRQRPTRRELLAVLRESVWALLLPPLIFGGIYSGVFTANKAAVVACFHVFIVESFIHGDMWLRDVKKVVDSSSTTSATLLVLGRRTAKEVRDVLFGSVTNHALHRVRCPVLLF
jgi:C4-dicarboxylate transporter DctM subunit